MIRAKHWREGKDLSGTWLVTFKLDGVRALTRINVGTHRRYTVHSRKGKPLYNLDHLCHTFTDAEIFCGSLEETISKVRASTQDRPVKKSEVYQLDPPDKRLVWQTIKNPKSDLIKEMLRIAIGNGKEGLVLRQGDKWLKVKGKRTYDVKVTGIQPGKGKHKGKLGALLTTKGEVGTGFKDKQRVEFNTKDMIGKLIEVECMSLTPAGKFRHARFKRVRWDK